MPSVIDLNAVTQTFVSSDGSPVTALQNVDLHLQRNEFVSLIGPSGCGKSTVLRLIAGLLRPSAGEVRIFDLPVTEPRSVQIAGGDAQMQADAARANVDLGAQIIDINMGCPAKKVCNKAAARCHTPCRRGPSRCRPNNGPSLAANCCD